MAESLSRLGRGRRLAAIGVIVASTAVLTCAAEAATPVVSVGPAGSPTGGTAAGTVGSGGQTDACVNQQHSGANPSATNANGVAQINDSACTASAGSSAAAQNGAASSSGTQPGGGSQTSATNTTTSNQRTSATRRSANSSHSIARHGTVSVSALHARGVKIARIRYQVKGAKAHQHLRLLVTLRDRQRRLVHSAIVSLGGIAGAKSTLSGLRAAFSNRNGQATFVVSLTKSMLGQRLLLQIGVRTPAAHTLAVASLRVPKQRLTLRGTHSQATGRRTGNVASLGRKI
jgi:hypothetical protein